MAYIIFYEKPGCINNTKQKKWLEAAGHEVEAINLLEQEWSVESLKPFFGKKPISECFNMTAPVIKSGELDPSDFSETAAFEAMIKEPILIKRPLINIDNDVFIQGFDKEKLHSLIGLSAVPGAEETVSELEKIDLTVCPNLEKNISCDEIRENQKMRPLGLLIEVVEKMGLQVTYAYDDLVFIEHNAFIFQFPETSGVNIYFNKECPDADAKEILQKITLTAKESGLEISRKGTFDMQQVEGEENIRIEMLDDPE